MTEYEEICNNKSVIELQDELQYQYKLGYSSTDSFPQYIQEQIIKRTRETINIKFKGIDDWNRPVYKVQEYNVYIGDVDKLFEWEATKEDVDSYFKDNLRNLCIFGNKFNEGDPLGTNLKKDIKINII